MWELGGAYERRGTLSSAARHLAQHAAFARCCQARPSVVCTLSTAGSAGALLQAARLPRHLSSVQFDAQGALLACGVSTGGVQVLDFLELRAQLQRREEGAAATVVTPILRLAPDRATEALRWSPSNQDVLATVSAADGDVHVFDLGICDDTPTEVLLGDAQACRALGVPRATAGGLGDLAFYHTDSRKVLAAGHGGKVCVWDTRTGHRPRAQLSAPRSSGNLMSAQLAHDDQAVYVAGEGGDICCWDLRGGRASVSAAFLAPNQVTYPLLCSLNVCALLRDVPGLTEEVHALLLDPVDSRRLAFQLACGWSGVISLVDLAITHVHCPPPPWLLSSEPQSATQHALWAIKHRPALVGDALLTGVRVAPAVQVLDVGASPAAGCHVSRGACTSACTAERTCRSCRRPLALRTAAPVVAVAVHPMGDDVVAGTQGCNVELLAKPNDAAAD